MPKHLCFCTASRSERSLIEPLVKRLAKSKCFDLHVEQLPLDFQGAYNFTMKYAVDNAVDLAIAPFDRMEMLGAALGFFFSNVPLVHIHSGDMTQYGTYDDVARHMIMLCSDVQFCCSTPSYVRAMNILESVGKSPDHCFRIDPMHFDDLVPDDSLVPAEPYDVVVYNPPTRMPEVTDSELDEIEKMLDKHTIWIEPNEDPGREVIIKRMKQLAKRKKIKIEKTLPRPIYIGLISKCERFISNSSSLFLEAPFFLDIRRLIHIGVRNTGREYAEGKRGGSQEIVEILEELYGQE